QKRRGGEGTGIVARLKAADDAGKRVYRAWVERVAHGRHAMILQFLHRLDDLVAELNGTDAEVALLDSRGLALDLDLEPDAPDAGRLHREIARFAGDAGIGSVASRNGVERAMAGDLLIDDDVDHHVTFWGEAELLQELHRQDVARHTALHVARAPAVN